MAPVGQTSVHAPQNRQAASARETSCRRMHVELAVLLTIVEHAHLAHVPTRPHAAAAQDTLVGVVDEQRVRTDHGKELGVPLDAQLLHAQVLLGPTVIANHRIYFSVGSSRRSGRKVRAPSRENFWYSRPSVLIVGDLDPSI